MRSILPWVLLLAVLGSSVFGPVARAQPGKRDEVTPRQVYDAIEKAKRWLLRQQRADGAWRGPGETYRVGVSSLAMLALLNCGMTPKDPEIQKGLKFLRSLDPHSVQLVYEASLLLQVFATAKDGKTDLARIAQLVGILENCQLADGPNVGLWHYNAAGPDIGGGDRSNGQFAVLGLREAQEAGVPVKLEVWRRARDHWAGSQMGGGGWSYRDGPIGSMTVAGIATMTITEAMARFPEDKQDKIDCCAEAPPDKHVEEGCRWMAQNFRIDRNPGSGNWWLYYMYGLERAGRLSGRRFFGEHDWYRDGADLLTRYQQATGNWESINGSEGDTMVSTCFALLFLSKGLAPVLINKLEFGDVDAGGNVVTRDWNNHRDDARNLTQFITAQDKWPKLLNWQIVEFPRANLENLLQAKVLLLSGREQFDVSDEQVVLLRQYIDQGGFIFAEASCQGTGSFDRSFRSLIERMFPNQESRLEKLKAEHPIYRAEYLIDPGKEGSAMPLEGVDVGCRTAIVYSRTNDLCCLWDHWTSFPLPKRSVKTVERITRAIHMGVNMVAYATGREVPDKLQPRDIDVAGAQDQIERGLIQIAKLRYTGDWDAAPQALRNLLLALNRTVGPVASTKQQSLLAQDANIFKYPLLYLHGRENFDLSTKEQDNLKLYLQRGNVLFVDACCSAPQFDKSFRRLMARLFPDHPLERIPADHEMFRATIGHDLSRVKRRELDVNQPDAALQLTVREGPPFLEGIAIDGCYVVIYSKFDLSCALEKQSSVACAGYVHEDAVRIAVNVVLYAMLQQPAVAAKP